MIEESIEQILERVSQRFSLGFKPLSLGEKTFEILDVENMTQYIDKLIGTHAIKNPLKDLPLWAKVWPGSFVLEMFLRKKVETQGKSFLELGCGCGVLSLLVSALGFSHMTASDIEQDALLFTKANVLKNELQDRIDVCHLDVTSPGVDARFKDGIDVIAASEILYLDELHRPLINFLDRHLAAKGIAVFCTDVARRKAHFAKIAAKQFTVKEVYAPSKITDEEGKVSQRLYSLLTLER